MQSGILDRLDRTGERPIRAHASVERSFLGVGIGLRSDRARAIFAGTIAVSTLLAAAILRFAILGSSDLFRDEGASWLVARYPLDQMVSHVSTEPYPPLYFAVLKAWIALIGDSAAAMRTLSAIAGLGTVCITWAWSRAAIGRGAAVVAGIVVGVAPLAVAESREVRMYALETLFATSSWWALWSLLVADPGMRRSTWLIASLAALAVAGALWTMPTGVVVVGLQVAVIAFLALNGNRGAGPAALALAAGVAAWLPWLPSLLGAASAERAYWTGPPALDSVPLAVQSMLGGAVAPPLYLVLVLLLLAAIGLVHLFLQHGATARTTALVVLGGVSLIGAWWLVSLVRAAYDVRYLGAALPFLAMAIGAGTWRLWLVVRPFVRPAVGLATIAAVAGFYASATGVHLQELNGAVAPTRAVILELERRVSPGDVVLAVDSRSYFGLAYEVAQPAGEALAATVSVRYWRSGREPRYFGSGLIAIDQTVTPQESEREGRFVMPGLATSGSIWVVALTNGIHELDRFAPLAAGQVRLVDRIQVRSRGVSAAIFRIKLSSDQLGAVAPRSS
ncbi:MAG: glycosyltransferase family 39 protein [Chloroflexota bacterium]|nr:glycosyltransferase family 39 protein [Chloroflexota bacterium]